jgi:16S rRNA A1518/A1519 N6-dimethyltransferase RsmA/KsgA/DIM1 with predicted DNA glycosylase/AP lyase activity
LKKTTNILNFDFQIFFLNSNFAKITANILNFKISNFKKITANIFSHHFLLSNLYYISLKFIMNHSNFNFNDAFDFDDDTLMFAFQVATAMVAKEESNN